MEEREEKLLKLEHFFNVDTQIKKAIYGLCPLDDEHYLREEAIIKYANDAYETLNFIFIELKCVIKDLFGIKSLIYAKTVILEEMTKKAFTVSGVDVKRLRNAYQNYVSDMSPEFVDSVKSECVGYSFNIISDSIKQMKTCNEILHLIHYYLINNDHFLQDIPAISEKNNNYNYPISLRGKNIPAFNELFNNFPENLDVGWTDIVVVSENKALMMIRDRGHALSIEITLNQNIARVEYFIPKLCNIEMINSLPGINKVDKNSTGATGVFEVPKEQLSNSLYEFIGNVPTDKDMIFENPLLQNR